MHKVRRGCSPQTVLKGEIMYICADCGATFEEPIKGNGIEKDSCPNCGEWGIFVAKKCPCCGEWMPVEGFDKVCKDCEDGFYDAIDLFVESYAETLDLVESEVIEMMMDYLERKQ